MIEDLLSFLTLVFLILLIRSFRVNTSLNKKITLIEKSLIRIKARNQAKRLNK